jgi:tetratricopeptide (TPR) repeat protein
MARAADPRAAEALLQRAAAALAAGDVSAADQLCRQALATRPTPDAMALLAQTHLAAGRPIAAIPLLKEALRARPDWSAARVELARALLESDARQEAARAAEAALAEGDGTNAHALDTLGVVMTRLGRHAAAAGLFAQAMTSAPSAGRAYNLADALMVCGRLDEARAAFRACLNLSPDHAGAWHGLAQLDASRAPGFRQEIEAAFDRATDPEARRLIGHGLARACEAEGDLAAALHYLHAAKVGVEPAPDAETEEAALFEAAEAAARQATWAPGGLSDAPVFVTGLPRSGTTLVDRILTGMPGLVSAGEPVSFPAALAKLTGARSSRLVHAELLHRAPSVDPDVLAAAYAEDIRRTTGVEGRWLDKLPLNAMLAPVILRALPQAKVICLVRHPADSVLSLYRQAFAADARDLHFTLRLSATASHVARFHRMAQLFEAHLPADRFAVVRYEAVVADPEAQARRLAEFCGLPFDRMAVAIETNAAPAPTASAVQVREPIHTRSVGRWRAWRPGLDLALSRLIDEGVMDRREL